MRTEIATQGDEPLTDKTDLRLIAREARRVLRSRSAKHREKVEAGRLLLALHEGDEARRNQSGNGAAALPPRNADDEAFAALRCACEGDGDDAEETPETDLDPPHERRSL